ncbi:MAG TPA: hypothetical protein VJ463_02320 [Geothrix sp.]|nr:hypothetical protein [Geothrix sp.]
MAFITLRTPSLSAEQKKRLGDRVLYALQQEGIAPGSTVLRFEAETSDLYLDGTLVEAERGSRPSHAAPQPVFSLTPPAAAPEAPAPKAAAPDFKGKARRNKQELQDLKEDLIKLLKAEGSLSSFDAQKRLGLDDCDWAPATLRRFFNELEEEQFISRTGQKRGTRYAWVQKRGEEHPAQVKLVKAEHHEE